MNIRILILVIVLVGCAQSTPYPKRDFQPCSNIGQCVSLIRNAISNNWIRPESAYLGLETIVLVYLDDSSNLTDVKVIKSSGLPTFDESAISAIKETAPFIELRGLPSEIFNKNFKKFKFHFKPLDLPKKT